ncbi:hypothetical protein FJY63_00640 [Candidatus Sumerlaeota bacterium]|nr:hypothetical protein [Candidatus Sumerlaeota bacterium]
MDNSHLALKRPPEFTTDADGRPMGVTLEPSAYVALLVRGNVTDPALWPPGTQQGAAALARVRQIEAECTAQHGEFDWGKLAEEVRDEYDDLCGVLDQLQDTGERITLEEYEQRRAENRP